MFSLITFLEKEKYWLSISPLCLFPPISAFEPLCVDAVDTGVFSFLLHHTQ